MGILRCVSYFFFVKTDRQRYIAFTDKDVFKPYYVWTLYAVNGKERTNIFGKVYNIKGKSKTTKKDSVHFAAFEQWRTRKCQK